MNDYDAAWSELKADIKADIDDWLELTTGDESHDAISTLRHIQNIMKALEVKHGLKD